jgi:hypothetical protein
MVKRITLGVILILVYTALILVGCNYYYNKHKDPKNDPDIINIADSIINTVDSLHTINDSLLQEIVRVDTVIQYIKVKGEKNSVIISNQSIEDDLRFFSDYIDRYEQQ